MGAYLSKVVRASGKVSLVMDREGVAGGHPIRIRKTVSAFAGSPILEIHYRLEDLPVGKTLHFAVENNVAAMAGHADDRYFSDAQGERLGMLDALLDLTEQSGVSLTDEWLDLQIELSWSRPARLRAFPIETVSRSEGGYEGVYQSSAVFAEWAVTTDESRAWEVRMAWQVASVREESQTLKTTERSGLLEVASES